MNHRVLKGSVAVLAAVAIAFGATGCSGGKPDKESVKSGLSKAYKEGGATASDEAINNFVGCIVDATYDKLNDSNLKKMADGQLNLNGKVSEDGFEEVYKARETCSSKLNG